MDAFQDQVNSSQILEKLNLEPKNYIPVTIHRSENVDDPIILQKILNALEIYINSLIKIIYPMHPRTKSRIKDLFLPNGLNIIDPLGFYDFNALSKNAFCLMGDSGTTPEEGLYYNVPCVSLRQTTERYETIEAGAHIVAGVESQAIVNAINIITSSPWGARYDFNENGFSPSNVVLNTIASNIKNYF